MGGLFETLFGFLKDIFNWLVEGIWYVIVTVINLAIEAIAGLLAVALALLPSPTFDWSPPAWLVQKASMLSWFFPMSTLIACLTIAGVAAAAYFPWKMITKFAHIQ